VGITRYSHIVRPHIEPALARIDAGVATLRAFARPLLADGRLPVLIPCADWYTEFLENASEYLDDAYRFLIPDLSLYREVSEKASFSCLLDRFGIPHPETKVFSKQGDRALSDFSRAIPYPAVLKPADSSAYWRHPFSGMKKVWFPKTAEEAKGIADRIYGAGYPGRLVLQRLIRPTRRSTLTVFCDTDAVARRAVLGDILLEERGGTAQGNYSAVLSRPLDRTSMALIRMLERVGYRGIANFDLLTEGDRTYVLELNPRQGRSSDYTRAAGVNLFSALISVLSGITVPTDFSCREVLWHCVPLDAVRRHATDSALLPRAEELIREGAVSSPFSYRPDLSGNPIRCLYTFLHGRRRSAALGEAK
ncbi:MAG TPA: hypothetical protein DDY70_05855, partial [Clostridiales bacterium]|nr:hypothetical protein [Clostridiales bacterium]